MDDGFKQTRGRRSAKDEEPSNGSGGSSKSTGSSSLYLPRRGPVDPVCAGSVPMSVPGETKPKSQPTDLARKALLNLIRKAWNNCPFIDHNHDPYICGLEKTNEMMDEISDVIRQWLFNGLTSMKLKDTDYELQLLTSHGKLFLP